MSGPYYKNNKSQLILLFFSIPKNIVAVIF